MELIGVEIAAVQSDFSQTSTLKSPTSMLRQMNQLQ
jgi:hypothetical protein